MDIKFNIIRVNVYDDNNKYIDNDLTHIPKYIEKSIGEIADKEIKKLIELGKFTIDGIDSYSYGGVGCGDNYRASYINSNGCCFAINYHYDGSSLNMNIELNQKFNDEISFVNPINNLKELQMLWDTDVKNLTKLVIKLEIKNTNCNNEEYDDI